VSAATSSSTTIVLTTGVAFVPASVAVIVTMAGLTLGPAQAAVSAGFRMSSSADAALSSGKDAPAIVATAGGTAPTTQSAAPPTAAVGSALALGTWSTAQLSGARSSFAATSVGNVAFFGGGRASGVLYTCMCWYGPFSPCECFLSCAPLQMVQICLSLWICTTC
jgi:hypothetical protein